VTLTDGADTGGLGVLRVADGLVGTCFVGVEVGSDEVGSDVVGSDVVGGDVDAGGRGEVAARLEVRVEVGVGELVGFDVPSSALCDVGVGVLGAGLVGVGDGAG
jgi:hypothetical protein